MTDAFFAQLDLAWLSARLDNRAVEGISFDGADLDKLNKTSGLRWAQVTLADGGRVPLVFKVSTTTPLAILLGLAREALFYCSWAQLPTAAGAECALGGVLPRVYHAEGCMATGEKVLVMEDLSAAGAVQLGHVFGGAGAWPGNPNNWGKDVAALTRGLPPGLSEAAATRLAFGAAATLHAPFWGCAALAAKPWLRGAGWIAGADREAWEQAQSHTREQWAQVKSRLGTASYTVNWDPRLVACIDAALAKVNARWAGLGFYRRARMLHEGSQQVVREHGGKLPETVEGLMRLRGIGREAFQTELRSRPFTLVHGDFHPANLLLVDGGRGVRLIDWEAVGLGSGPQELGQFMISHVEPGARAAMERGAVAAYHAELTRLNARVGMTLAECWAEYVAGGLGRWLYFLPYDGWGAPPAVSQFFCEQVLAFIVAHGVTPETVPMPRM